MEWTLDMHALELVFASSFILTLALYGRSLKGVFGAVWTHSLNYRRTNMSKLGDDILLASRFFISRSAPLQAMVEGAEHPFLRECTDLLVDGIADEKNMEKILKARIAFRFESQIRQVERVRAIARIPVACGLAAAVWYMSQGLSAGAASTLVCAVAISHVFLLPLADRMEERVNDERHIWSLIAQGTRLILLRTNPVLVAEFLNSHLDPADRIQWMTPALPGRKAA